MRKFISVAAMVLGGCVAQPQAAYTYPDTLYINTRAVIEIGETQVGATEDSVKVALKYAESVFSNANVRFIITQIDYIPVTSWDKLMIDGVKHPDSYNIYFTIQGLPRDNIVGLSYLPQQMNAGTSIISSYPSISIAAHEIGHGLGGLLHTFEDDGCKDTPSRSEYVGDYDLYANLMNYHNNVYDFITPQQADLMRKNILKFSQKRLLRNYNR